jgi:hypothetical protein
MNEQAIQNDPELQRTLWACFDYWRREEGPPAERMICHYWVIDPYRDRFGGTFHQAKLRRLANLGFLRELYTVRGGSRRDYAIANPEGVEQLLNAWTLN